VYVNEALMNTSPLRMPRLAEHLGAFDMRAVLYAPAWVLTVFSAEFPSEFAERVMDLVLVAEKPLELMLQVRAPSNLRGPA